MLGDLFVRDERVSASVNSSAVSPPGIEAEGRDREAGSVHESPARKQRWREAAYESRS